MQINKFSDGDLQPRGSPKMTKPFCGIFTPSSSMLNGGRNISINACYAEKWKDEKTGRISYIAQTSLRDRVLKIVNT